MMIDPRIKQSDVKANGITIHFAEIGEGPTVLLCHGFPESWYSWRHQMTALADAGFRAIAPDMRGYGGTDAPEDVGAYSLLHLVGDAVGLLDALGIERASVVGHDWGAPVAWNAATLRPDRFDAVVGMGTPFLPRGPMSSLEGIRRHGWTTFYQLYFQEPGRTEREFEADVEATMRRSFWTLSAGPEVPWDGSIGDRGAFESFWEPTRPMPWMPDEDLAVFTAAFAAKGFRGALNWYRNIDRNWALAAPFQGLVPPQPAYFLTGDRDPILRVFRPMVEALPDVLPDLRGVSFVEGAGHWVQQEAPDEVNRLLLDFLNQVRG